MDRCCCCFAAVRRFFTNSARHRLADRQSIQCSVRCAENGPAGRTDHLQDPLLLHSIATAGTKHGTSQQPAFPTVATAQDTAASLREGTSYENGFRVLPEIERIVVDPKNIADFTLPHEAITFEAGDSQIFARFKHGDFERMIHSNTPLLPQEQRGLTQMRELAEEANMAFYPSLAAAGTRFLNDARGDAKKALENMQTAQNWRTNYFRNGPIRDVDVAPDLGFGVVYFAGRDSCMRPVLVARPARSPRHLSNSAGVKRLIKGLIFMVEYFNRYMAIPGRVENMVILVDLRGLSISQIPLSSLHEVAHVLTQQHASRVWKFYICNMSMVLRGLSTLVQAVMTDRQKKKIVFVKSFEALRQDIAPHQLEEDLGGTRPILKTFYPFPLLPGPFEIDSVQTSEDVAVRGCHALLSAAGARGRQWDPSLSVEENTTLDYSASAVDILRKCNLPIPQQLVVDLSASQCASDDVDRSTCVASPVSSFAEVAVSDADQEVFLQESPASRKQITCTLFGFNVTCSAPTE